MVVSTLADIQPVVDSEHTDTEKEEDLGTDLGVLVVVLEGPADLADLKSLDDDAGLVGDRG